MSAYNPKSDPLFHQIMNHVPYIKALGASFVDEDEIFNRSREQGLTYPPILLKLPYREDLVGDPKTGVLASGVVTSLLDQGCGMAVWAAVGGFQPVATLDLRIDYMRPSQKGEILWFEAHCYKLTKTIAFVRALAFDQSPDDPVAAAQAAFILTAPKPSTSKGGSELEPKVSQ